MADPVYLTINEFPGTGAAAPTVVDFNFAGGYISPAHVKAEIFNPVTYLRTPVTVTDDNFVTDYRLSLPVVVPTGSILRVYRDTPKDQPLVDFTNGARIAENNLDLVAQQAVFVAAESADQIEATQVADVLQAVEAAALSAAAAQTDAAASAASATLSQAAAQEGASIAGGFALSAASSAAESSASAAASAAEASAVRADLASTSAGKGGFMVRWIQAGVGAVQQWISDALRERLSITQFGAVAAAGVDNTAAIQAAINEALASGKALKVPATLVPFEHGALTVPYDATNTKRLRIVGDHGISYFLANKTSALQFTGTSGHAITIQGRAGGDGGNNQGHPVSFELSRVALIGNASCEGAVRIARGWFATIEKNGFFGFGKVIGSVIEFDADDVDAGGISFAGTSNIEGNTFASSGRCVVLTGATGGVVNAVTIRGNKMLDQSYGVVCNFAGAPYAEHVIIEGNHFEGTLESDVYSQGAAANWVIERNYFEQNEPTKNAPRVDIQGSANFNIIVQRNTFSKTLQGTGQALVRIANAQGVSVINNVSNSGGINDRYSVQLTSCLEAECEPFECPATPTQPYPIDINGALHYRGRVNDKWRVVPATSAGNWVGVSGGDGWPGSTVSTAQAEYNKTNGLVSYSFNVTVTAKSTVVGNVLLGVLPKPNSGFDVYVPLTTKNVTGTKPIYGVLRAGYTTLDVYDANGVALDYQSALVNGSEFHAQFHYLTQE